MKAIYNARIITTAGILEKYAVVYSDKIIAVVPEPALAGYILTDRMNARGHYLAPGFIDLHIHGGAGADTMDVAGDALAVMSRILPQSGVTAFLPTTMTMKFELVTAALERVRAQIGHCPGAEILGCHFEGPFINADYKGAQDAQYITTPSFAKIAGFADVIKIATIAPELPGSLAFIREAVDHNIVVSIGHSAATYEQALAAITAGTSHVTHMFNAIAASNHRRPGVLGAILDSSVTCELIADNIHVHPASQRLLYRLTGGERLILITDAMRACLMPDGYYELGGQQVSVADSTAQLDNGVIAGSVLTLDKAVANFRKTSGLALHEVVNMVTMNPARKLRMDHCKGSIVPGNQADMVIFDENITILETIVKGRTVYRRWPHADSDCQRL
ncbi:N-acetylglucosamine-6-phosphate deacetylase [Sporomusa sp.]|uniref:N-acetylglucosamine-6-phosphate deacetylase n=1 Tax=Sporomusa sp. TaxID=2078658 RepID=UPI002B553859|nr:N-acetylglucosamine-6-phosphate deacetylase [Sporomusa sp.]HWR42368.1 N-acetylglucosamine-6-phosphate deacetylase [Sporomusa sp.]